MDGLAGPSSAFDAAATEIREEPYSMVSQIVIAFTLRGGMRGASAD